MKRWELLAGCGLGVIVYLVWRGVDLTPLLAIGGALLLLFLLTQGRFRNLETLGGQSVNRSDTRIGFEDIGGQEVAKRELLEALDFVRDAGRTQALGIRPLKGILLTGPPGTGKTLLAKAASSYTDSIFVAASGSEFIEMYAGVGAQRVRQLFGKARQQAKQSGKKSAIVFVDEIEVIAGQRGSHTSHLEYDQTLNQLLVEMDGLKPDEAVKILVIAATNRADLLDPAILRPGRFDRQVKVDLPDREGRLHILKIHAKGKPLADGVSLEEIAKDTFGFSGAHLESLVNEAAILAFRKERTAIAMEDFRESIDKVMMGEKLDRRPQDGELRRVAVHETGHAMVSELLRPESVATLTVVPRGKALGFMRQTQTEEQYLYTRQYLEDQIAICLGGAMAEELIYGNWSTGSANDFEQATSIAKQMLKTGLTRLGIIHEDLVGREQMHEVVTELMEEQKVRVRELLKSKESFFAAVIDDLLEREKVSGEWFRAKLQCA